METLYPLLIGKLALWPWLKTTNVVTTITGTVITTLNSVLKFVMMHGLVSTASPINPITNVISKRTFLKPILNLVSIGGFNV